MRKRKLPPEMTVVLRTTHFAYLCTTNKDNQPHITPMFFVLDEATNDLYVVASTESKKMKNLGVNPKVSLTVDIRDVSNPFDNRGVMVQGKAVVEKTIDSISVVTDEQLVRAYETFRKKYPVLKKAQPSVVAEYKEFSETLIRIVPKKMVYWRGPKFMSVSFDGHGHVSSP